MRLPVIEPDGDDTSRGRQIPTNWVIRVTILRRNHRIRMSVVINVNSQIIEIICLKVAYFSRATTFERQLYDRRGIDGDTRLSHSQKKFLPLTENKVLKETVRLKRPGYCIELKYINVTTKELYEKLHEGLHEKTILRSNVALSGTY